MRHVWQWEAKDKAAHWVWRERKAEQTNTCVHYVYLSAVGVCACVFPCLWLHLRTKIWKEYFWLRAAFQRLQLIHCHHINLTFHLIGVCYTGCLSGAFFSGPPHGPPSRANLKLLFRLLCLSDLRTEIHDCVMGCECCQIGCIKSCSPGE